MTSSLDGWVFRAGGHDEASADINAKYGRTPGPKFYTHISDQFSPFHSTVITATESEAPFVLDGLLGHRTGVAIEEHHVDTGGATDHVFALCYLLGFRPAPRLRNFKDHKLYLLPGMKPPAIMTPFIDGTIKVGAIIESWSEILRLATSIQAGTTIASAILKNLTAYPRQNGLAIALRELGRLARTLFALEWMRSLELRKEQAQVWPEEKPETPSHARPSSTSSERCATAVMSIRSTKHLASIFRSQLSSCGIRNIWKPRSMICGRM